MKTDANSLIDLDFLGTIEYQRNIKCGILELKKISFKQQETKLEPIKETKVANKQYALREINITE